MVAKYTTIAFEISTKSLQYKKVAAKLGRKSCELKFTTKACVGMLQIELNQSNSDTI